MNGFLDRLCAFLDRTFPGVPLNVCGWCGIDTPGASACGDECEKALDAYMETAL